MEIWEIDPLGYPDDYIEKMTFPNCSIILDCSYGSCDGGYSSWKNPTAWDSGSSGPKTDARIRLRVYGADLVWEYW